MKDQNILEFKALIERYEIITLSEIKNAFKISIDPAKSLTGFGDIKTCTLCISVNSDCMICCLGGKDYLHHCNSFELKKSYFRIENSNSPIKLLNAYRNRAKVLREFAKNKKIKL